MPMSAQETPNAQEAQETPNDQESQEAQKLVLVLMIKNEEKIIKRCIQSALAICDAVCITDTGSTDNTINIVEDFFEELSIPCKLYENPWINFGASRTQSYDNAVHFCKSLGYSGQKTYGLLIDADMKLKFSPTFSSSLLTQDGYTIIQENSIMKYHNIRFVRLDGTWKCVGVTHEYWASSTGDVGMLSRDLIYIDDVGDGGCKGDKLERDARLLIKGLEDEPDNVRYYFYLAQTYRDSGKFDQSIEMYKKRIEKGGWDEEVYYSYFSIAYCYVLQGKLHEAEMWGQKAYDFRPTRAEAIYLLTKVFREKGQHIKALHYHNIGSKIKQSNDVLFVEKMEGKFEFEYSVLHYYVYPDNKLHGLKSIVNYINSKTVLSENIVMNNMYFYVEQLPHVSLIDMKLPKIMSEGVTYNASSPSLLERDGKLLMNIRYINYILNDNLQYEFAGSDILTINALVYLDKNFEMCSGITLMSNIPFDSPKSNIRGLEDVRLFLQSFSSDRVFYTATSREFTPVNRMIYGEYDTVTMRYMNNIVITPPTETDCEKNWISIPHSQGGVPTFIYKWHPLQIGTLNGTKLNITSRIETPEIFKLMRGSSPLVEYRGDYWCITHGVKQRQNNTRQYYHFIVVLNKNTFEVLKYSVPFYFDTFDIEYCVGMIIKDDYMYATFSKRDRNPHLIKSSLSDISLLFL